ncbi:MAG: hypothetical protein GY933_21985 [Hyphomicrobiales bacterium]|nr:hypothetical protein [Hyphomicrobiales bacterium]MCP5001334.1 hypothetical protein [Hyphomicrobiales bacterium]
MFTNIIKATTLAALIAVGATAATTSQASAGQVQFGITFGTPGYGGPYWGPGPSWGAPRGYCKPRRAVNKARRLGVRNARIVRRNRNRLVVRGWRYGYQTRVVFANARRCPIIRFR